MKVTYLPTPSTRAGECIRVRDMQLGEEVHISYPGAHYSLFMWKVEMHRGQVYWARHVPKYNTTGVWDYLYTETYLKATPECLFETGIVQ